MNAPTKTMSTPMLVDLGVAPDAGPQDSSRLRK